MCAVEEIEFGALDVNFDQVGGGVWSGVVKEE